jgi:uncharacterized membrane protein
MTADGTDAIPFAGLRRNSRALIVGFGLTIGILFLLPDLAPPPPPGDVPSVQLAHGRILEIIPSTNPSQPEVRIEVLEDVADGPLRGDIVEGIIAGVTERPPDYAVGEEVIVDISTDPSAGFVAIHDRYRIPTLSLLAALFAGAVILVGGWQGVRSLLALAFTLVVMVRIVIPLILAGWDAALVAIVAATGVTIVTFALTEGVRRQTFAAVMATAASLTLVAVLASIFDGLSRFTPLRGSESAGFLISIGGASIDLGGVILAAIIFGALGVLDDVTITQAATVNELYSADPMSSRAALAGRAMRVGRSHIAATVNTLVLAYVGASLPLLILFVAGRQEPSLIVSGEVVAVEVVRALSGSIGIVAAVPATTMFAVALIGRRLPFIGEGTGVRRAPGWD